MILHFSREELDKLNDLEKRYTALIKEAEAKADALREDSFLADGKKKEDFDAYIEWINAGSIEWKDARHEVFKLVAEYDDEREKLISDFAVSHFASLGGDREKILADAKSQAEELISNRHNYIKIASHDQKVRIDEDMYLGAQNVINDIKDCVKLHFDFFKDDPDATEELNRIILDVVSSSPYVLTRITKQRKSRSKKNLPTFTGYLDQELMMIPTTQTNDIILGLFWSNGSAKKTAEKINTVSKRKQAKALVSSTESAIEVENDKTHVRIEYSPDQDVNGQTSSKIMLFIENEIYQRAYYKGSLNDYIVTFPLQKMVDKKLYSSTSNAGRAFQDAKKTLTSIRASATVKTGKSDVSTNANGTFVLFPTMTYKNGQCFVRLNPDINWSPILENFAPVPDSFWALPANAYQLEYKIFRQMRLDKNKISKDGKLTFNISLKTVATWLQLPLDTKNPKRDVKDPIETAVQQILNSLDPEHFSIEINTDLNAPLPKYLSGYLVITCDGVYTENILNMNERQQARIESATKRKERIVNKASVISLSKKMENEISDEKNS